MNNLDLSLLSQKNSPSYSPHKSNEAASIEPPPKTQTTNWKQKLFSSKTRPSNVTDDFGSRQLSESELANREEIKRRIGDSQPWSMYVSNFKGYYCSWFGGVHNQALELKNYNYFNSMSASEKETKVYPLLRPSNRRDFEVNYPLVHRMNHTPKTEAYPRLTENLYEPDTETKFDNILTNMVYKGFYSLSQDYMEFKSLINSYVFGGT